ncbi:MAG: NYN domain-containing protein [Spirochaetaceae bacterium]|nr:MAG: NYN domain-containing protein [Spirochaetaceae bacterium]
MTNTDKQHRLAVLIDADNTQGSIIEGLLEEIAKYGVASVKRIYGDWTSPNLKGWKDVLLEHSVQPIQQFSYTQGKNSTDSAMIIDAMDILFTGAMDGFCIVSSDSDFTRIAARIREAGLTVYGFGEKKTPKAFVGACDKFIYTEILRKDMRESESEPQSAPRRPSKDLRSDTKLVNLLRNAVEDSANENGWAHLATVGQNIANKSSEFDPRNYGYVKLGELVKAVGLFELDERGSDNSPARNVYVRDKRRQ